MAAPYWGQLPTRTGSQHARRTSEDYTSTAPRRQSGDANPQAQPRANRVSALSGFTDAPTDSTLSPYASPVTSSFNPHGLAPRPPSYQPGLDRQPDEFLDRRRRRQSQDQVEELPSGVNTPPPAPDVPKAPPLSYRSPLGNGGSPYIPPGAGPPQPIARRAMQEQEFYKSPTPEGYTREQYPVLDRTQPGFAAGQQAQHARRRSGGPDMVPARSGSTREPANGGHPRDVRSSTDPMAHRRRASGGGQGGAQPDRRKKLADDRSPLQRLELTLDSITKEEKRARMEAAEQRIRDKEAGLAQKSPAAQQVRFKDRAPATLNGQNAGLHVEPALQTPSLAVHKGPLSQNPPEEGKRYGSSDGPKQSPQSEGFEPKTPVSPTAHGSGIPQRNLSFRERAAKNDVKLPQVNGTTASDSPVTPSEKTGGFASGFSLTRSGSNKLKKDPPADAWNNRRESLKGTPTAATAPFQGRNGPVAPDSVPAAGPTYGAPVGRSVRDKELPSIPPNQSPAELGPPDLARWQGPAKVAKAPSQRKPVTFADPVQPTARGLGSDDDIHGQHYQMSPAGAATAGAAAAGAGAMGARRAARRQDDDSDTDSERHHRVSGMVYNAKGKLQPGQGVYQPPEYLDEWKKATIGTLAGTLLDLKDERPQQTAPDGNKAWWETPPSQRRGSVNAKSRKGEAYDGEYEDTNAPTRFKPPLYLKCGPLLRYCGMRTERTQSRTNRVEKDIWRGSVMIVTQDSESSYDIAPTLRMFVQPIELLPPPPAEVTGSLPPEYIDPLAGHPKLGRKGETVYVRPVDHLEEAKDFSRDETDSGLFERTRSPPDEPLPAGAADPPGSFAARRKRIKLDGEKVDKYKEVRGFRLHAERGCTFWRFNIEVELTSTQQRIAYRINRGPSTGFWVPAKGQTMNVMFHSCNGFSLSVSPDELSGPDPMWRDVLNTHQTQPFHVMVGGGDQIYNDCIMRDTEIFQEWLMIKNPLHKHNAPFTAEMQAEMEGFYLDRYCMWFSQGLFGLANSMIPMVNMYDDHDIIDGFGSYPHHFMNSPVFSGLGNVAFKYYMLFQHQSVPEETEKDEPSWILGTQPGPYINEVSRSVYVGLGSKMALLAVDCRTERTRDEVVREATWTKVVDRCYDEIVRGKTEHLLVLLGVPIAYPRLVWLENILTSRLMDPIKALGKTGLLGGFLNKFDGGVEVLDDLDDHWTAKNHKKERAYLIEDLQDLAADKSVRITILSGDVHLAAVGQFYSNPKLKIPKHKDCRYMPNIISSAIVNTPPPDLLADVLNKRNKIHHFDAETDENMIPLFSHGVEGKPRNNKHLLPHRNWCAIREYVPGTTPPGTPDTSTHDLTPLGTPPGSKPNLLRRLSKTRKGPTFRPDASPSRPPVSTAGRLLRTFSRGRESSDAPPHDRPGAPTRTLSLTRGNFKPGNLFRRLSGRRKPDDGGINGAWGPDSDGEEDLPPAAARRLGISTRGNGPAPADHVPPPAASRKLGIPTGGGSQRRRAPDPYEVEDDYTDEDYYSSHTPPRAPEPRRTAGVGLRGGAGGYTEEFEDGDESYFSAQPRRAHTQPVSTPTTTNPTAQQRDFEPRPFHRTPTGLSVKQMKKAEQYEVNLEGGLVVSLNVEVNPKDPAGITAPYRFVVPRLFYEYGGEGEDGEGEGEEEVQVPKRGNSVGGGIKRLLSLRREKGA